ncbi:MAG: M17 family metallopeptidase [Sulfuriferula sp.]
MLAKLIENKKQISVAQMDKANHILMVLPKTAALPQEGALPGLAQLAAALRRRDKKPVELAKTPVAVETAHGGLIVWVMLDTKQPTFSQHSVLRQALHILLDESPREISLAISGDEDFRAQAAAAAVYVAWINGAALPSLKSKDRPKPLQTMRLFGHVSTDGFAAQRAVAEGNTLCRSLTVTPPNQLTPSIYRERVRELAKDNGWKHTEYDMKKLRKLGAGAFVAVGQGSDPEDAAIVHLRHRHPKARLTVAIVGKGICFDTGGHNLKPARYMQGMHEDMNGSAVALGILVAATRLNLPVNIDCWLAIAQNHISAKAYKQNDVVTALNGTTIEVVHTDAEGRMVLADTLALAAREKPDAMVDFATLTGSMGAALGERYSGVLSNRDELLSQAVAAGKVSGERMCAFPMDEDYEPALDSDIADIKQCTLDGDADHILAARFLNRFVDKRPWLHVDLSSSNCDDGLGAVGTGVTGFGVAWGISLLSGLQVSK